MSDNHNHRTIFTKIRELLEAGQYEEAYTIFDTELTNHFDTGFDLGANQDEEETGLPSRTLEDYMPNLYQLRRLVVATIKRISTSQDLASSIWPEAELADGMTESEWFRSGDLDDVMSAIICDIVNNIMGVYFGCLEMGGLARVAAQFEELITNDDLTYKIVQGIVTEARAITPTADTAELPN